MLGLGLGMGVGNKAPLLPVSAFPSIDPGALVLDSDGVVKTYKYAYYPIGTGTGDILSFPVIENLDEDWRISFKFIDLNPTVGPSQVFYLIKTATHIRVLQITRNSIDSFSFYIKDSDDTNPRSSAPTANSVIQNQWNRLLLYRVGGSIFLSLNGGVPVSISIGTWINTGCASSVLAAWSLNEKPAFVSTIRQCVNGILCDEFPLDENSGLVARNIIRPSRPGTYIQNSHAMTLVPV